MYLLVSPSLHPPTPLPLTHHPLGRLTTATLLSLADLHLLLPDRDGTDCVSVNCLGTFRSPEGATPLTMTCLSVCPSVCLLRRRDALQKPAVIVCGSV